MEKANVTLSFIHTQKLLADIYTKPLTPNRFAFICMKLGMLDEFA